MPSRNHVYESPPEAVSTVDPPAQILVVAGLIAPDGVGLTVTVAVFDAGTEQLPSLIITLYVPACVAVSVLLVCPSITTPSRLHS